MITFSSLRIVLSRSAASSSNSSSSSRDNLFNHRRHIFHILILYLVSLYINCNTYCLLLQSIPTVEADLLNNKQHSLRIRNLDVIKDIDMLEAIKDDRPNSLILVPETVENIEFSLKEHIAKMYEYVPLKEQMELEQQLHCDTDEDDDANITPMSDWIVTETNSSEYFNQYSEISDFLQGPALDHIDLLTEAACEFRNLIFAHHFPHMMQQLYRCWSWWQSNPNLPRVLYWGDRDFDLSDYIQSFLDVLVNDEQIRLRVVDGPSETEFTVSSKNTGRWFDDIELTDFALLKPEHATELSHVFQRHIDTSTFKPGGCHVKSNNETTYPKILILNRAPYDHRTIVDSNILFDEIQRQFLGISIREVYFENNVTYLQQVQYFMESDIIITPHGAQTTGIIFQPTENKCSQILEFLPKDYLVADYFGSLAKAAGIRHTFFYMVNESDRQSIPKERSYHYYQSSKYRDTMNCLNVTKVMDALSTMVYDWQQCCLKSNVLI